jgi:hypothetical protein
MTNIYKDKTSASKHFFYKIKIDEENNSFYKSLWPSAALYVVTP